MNFEELPARRAAAVGLLAVIPALWYAFGLSLTAGIVTAINVVIIYATLYVAMEPVPGHGHGSNGHDNGGEAAT